jgi:hypothetical protein
LKESECEVVTSGAWCRQRCDAVSLVQQWHLSALLSTLLPATDPHRARVATMLRCPSQVDARTHTALCGSDCIVAALESGGLDLAEGAHPSPGK